MCELKLALKFIDKAITSHNNLIRSQEGASMGQPAPRHPKATTAERLVDFRARLWSGIKRRRRMAYVIVTVFVLGLICISAGILNFVQHEWKDLALHLGVDFLSASVVFIAFEIILERIEDDKVRTHRKLNHGLVINNINAASVEVRIWESWTNLFTNDKGANCTFADAIVAAIQRGAIFQILLVKPGSTGMNKRQIDLDGGITEYKEKRKKQNWPTECDVEWNVLDNLRRLEEVREAISRSRELPQGSANRLEIKLYEAPPTIALYDWGPKAWASFFPEKEFSDQREQLEYSTDTGIGRFIDGQFKRAWKHGLSYEDEPKELVIWAIDKDKPDFRLLPPAKVMFIENAVEFEGEDADKDGNYLFCVADTESGAGSILSLEVRGYANVLIVCPDRELQKSKIFTEDMLVDHVDYYEVERYRNLQSTRMESLFDAKYGRMPGRHIFRLTRANTSR